MVVKSCKEAKALFSPMSYLRLYISTQAVAGTQ